jgi:hypothetical protein
MGLKLAMGALPRAILTFQLRLRSGFLGVPIYCGAQVRIKSGEEVIRRHCKLPKDADERRLRAAAQQVVQDEGYERVRGAAHSVLGVRPSLGAKASGYCNYTLPNNGDKKA